MAVPILRLLPKILKTAASILGVGSVNDVVEALQSNRLTPEQRAALEAAMLEHQKDMRQLDIDELRVVMSETQAMIASPDKYVARARPTGLYVAYAISVGLAVALIAGTEVDATAILTLCAPLYGAQGYYMHLRTQEKLAQ